MDSDEIVQMAKNPDALYKDALRKLEQLAQAQPDPTLNKCIEIYANTSRPYCVPSFLPFDKNDPAHRLDDQFLCGFPFTSVSWPWPTNDKGIYKQPVVQINLTRAAELLGMNLGSGLLQVWGNIDENEQVLESRIIPIEYLEEPLNSFYPEDAPWEESFSLRCTLNVDFDEYPPFGPECCRIEWLKLGRMFYPSFHQRIYENNKYDSIGDLDLSHDISSNLQDLDESLEILGIPTSNLFDYLGGQLCRIGGYQEGLDVPWNFFLDKPILFYFSVDYGVLVSLGVSYEKDESGEIVFSADVSYC